MHTYTCQASATADTVESSAGAAQSPTQTTSGPVEDRPVVRRCCSLRAQRREVLRRNQEQQRIEKLLWAMSRAEHPRIVALRNPPISQRNPATLKGQTEKRQTKRLHKPIYLRTSVGTEPTFTTRQTQPGTQAASSASSAAAHIQVAREDSRTEESVLRTQEIALRAEESALRAEAALIRAEETIRAAENQRRAAQEARLQEFRAQETIRYIQEAALEAESRALQWALTIQNEITERQQERNTRTSGSTNVTEAPPSVAPVRRFATAQPVARMAAPCEPAGCCVML